MEILNLGHGRKLYAEQDSKGRWTLCVMDANKYRNAPVKLNTWREVEAYAVKHYFRPMPQLR